MSICFRAVQHLVEVCLAQELIECVEEGIALSGFDVPDYDGHLLSRGGVSAPSLSLSSEWQKD